MSIRNVVLFTLLLTLSLFALACQKHDQPVAPLATQVESIPFPEALRASIESATAPVNITSLAEFASAAESVPNVFTVEGTGSPKFSRLLSMAPNPESENLALQAYPSASSYWPWIPPGGTYLMTPDHANNGNPSDAWHSRFYDYNIWFRLDWSQAQTISRIYINHNPWYWLGQTVSSIRYLSPSGVWSTVPVSFPIYSGYSTAPIVDVSFPPVEAVSLIVYMRPGPQNPHPNWAVFISEIEVYGGASLKIVAPSDNSVFDRGQPITFLGEKTGNVTNIQWSSDLDGLIGTSFPSIATSGLRVGTHTITLSGVVGGPVASIKSEVSPSIRGLAPGSPVSHSIKVGISGGKPRVTRIAFLPMTGTNNLNRLFDREGLLAAQKPGKSDKFLDPLQWEGKKDSGEVTQLYSWPVSYVRDSPVSMPLGSKIKLAVTFEDLDNSPSLLFQVNVSGKITGQPGSIGFPVSGGLTFGNQEITVEIQSVDNLPKTPGNWNLELEWTFSKNGVSLGSQKTNHALLTTWEKPIVTGYFFQDEESKKGGPMKVEEIPTYYLEVARLSCEFCKSAEFYSSKNDVLSKLFSGAWDLGSHGYKYDVKTLIIPGVTPRGLDSLLIGKTGRCQEWSAFFKALAESQGIDIWYCGIELTPEQISILKHRLYLTNRDLPALGGDTQNQNPNPYYWWVFRDHAYNSPNLLDVYDLSFNGQSPSIETYINNSFDLVIFPTREIYNPDPFPADIHILLSYD